MSRDITITKINVTNSAVATATRENLRVTGNSRLGGGRISFLSVASKMIRRSRSNAMSKPMKKPTTPQPNTRLAPLTSGKSKTARLKLRP